MAIGAAALDGRERTAGVTAVSRLYRTPPWGKTDQAWFFNCLRGGGNTLGAGRASRCSACRSSGR